MKPVADEIQNHTKFLIETQVMKQTNSAVYHEIWGEISDPVWDHWSQILNAFTDGTQS
jgi:hypothetical protein